MRLYKIQPEVEKFNLKLNKKKAASFKPPGGGRAGMKKRQARKYLTPTKSLI